MTNNKYTRLVKLQKAFFNEHITREIPFRLCALDRLAEALVSREKQLGEALHADLGKSAFESYATEIGFLLHEIRTTKNHLQSWARDRRRPTPLFLFGSKSRIHYEPYGCALIIAPWNYPLQLALSPLIGAIAAGNCAIVKPSGEAPCRSARPYRRMFRGRIHRRYRCRSGNHRVTPARTVRLHLLHRRCRIRVSRHASRISPPHPRHTRTGRKKSLYRR